MNDEQGVKKFGFITIAGVPNVGKSTLINRLMGQKISIISRKPQTTRHRILGIKTTENAQMVFVDTPGIHHDQKKSLNKMINRTAINALSDVDLILFMLDHHGWTRESRRAFEYVKQQNVDVILLLNKMDRIKNKKTLLPLIDTSQKLFDFKAIIPISAKHLDVEQFIHDICVFLPEGEAGFPEDQITDKGDRFIAAELVREQTLRRLGQELPYSSAIEIEKFEYENDLLKIDVVIWVERDGQKTIVIGKNGEQIKAIGSGSRLELEKYFGCKVFLSTWVKVRKGWADNAQVLRSLGYSED